ncbi:hypothetical protein B0H14DRAFT_2562045 [Mycena olivaceomarginata]|nr:hypothetical protein B0H14DRAFT_2562045 [Mycena olivaceomarginata]
MSGLSPDACKPSKGITQEISDLFAREPRANLVPSTVSSVPLVDASTSDISAVGGGTSLVSSPSREPSPDVDTTAIGGDAPISPNYMPPEYPTPNEAPTPGSDWPLYNEFDNLRFKMEQIPASLTGDTLAAFAGNPAYYFPQEIHPSDGLDAFCTFFEYFVREGEYPVKNILDVILFLEEDIDNEFPEVDSSFDAADGLRMIQTTTSSLDAAPRLFRTGKLERLFRPKERRGWMLMFPEGKNAHTSYPFELRTECALPVSSIGFAMVFTKTHDLFSHLVELNRRRAEQVREKKLLKLNDTRTIMRKMTTIDIQKELTMAIASGEIMRVSHVLCAGYRNGAGTKGMIELCRRAARGEYKP